ncbi:GNAT family N-acetyltransferase [Alkaliphilus peptidifermentans]|uniref:FR47-like protein n=1 Tax=Alkaliphilus peptidifermentans DSM 18978 TaxID=1120976 RepID=A0A1G5KBW4_9FIRM|nr:GNAT family N-acetyltransferase [Alkaliphilus peptidifermentans]SCY97459.1 FR47-like protein [Alkaliphilus peptidifermentans DSM 18978]
MYLTDNWSIIDPLIRDNIAANLNTIGRMKNNKGIKIYVDNLESPRGFVLKDDYWVIPYSKDEDMVRSMLSSFPLTDEVGFCGIQNKTAEIVMKHLKEYELAWDEDCELFYLPEELYSKYENLEGLPYLQEQDIEIVDRYYTYRDETSREYLLECIKNRPSSKLTNQEGSPISWALVREDNSLGVMYTVSDYRNKGLAKIITADLIHKTIARGNIPYVHIRADNNASKNLAKEMGFVFWDKILWFGLRKKSRKEE